MANMIGAQVANVTTVSGTPGTAYATGATGASVTVTVDSSKLVFVMISGKLTSLTASTSCQVSFEASGVNSITAGAPYEASVSTANAVFNQFYLVPVANPGSMNFVMKAKYTGSTNRNCVWGNLAIAVTSPR